MSNITRSLSVLAATATLGLGAAPALAQTDHHRGDRGHGKSTSQHGGDNRDQGSARASGLDRAWLKHIAQADLAEIATGTLAQQKGTSEGVKSLGAMLAADHAKHLQLVQALADRFGASVPTTPSPSQKWEAAVLASFTGSTFDQQWIAAQIADHLTNIEKTQDEIADGRNQLVVALAKMTLPTLQAHLAAAQQLAGTSTSTSSGATSDAGTTSGSGTTSASGSPSNCDQPSAAGQSGDGSTWGDDQGDGAEPSSSARDHQHGDGCCGSDGSGSSSSQS